MQLYLFSHNRTNQCAAWPKLSEVGWKRLGTYSLRSKTGRLGQRHSLQDTTLISCHYNTIYQRVIYLYFYESICQDKSIRIVFTSANSIAQKLLMIQILNVWLQPCPKRQVFRRELFTCMPLRKLPVTCMPWKSSQAPVCHAPEVRWRTCHFGWMES
jgi:hypothetical protein